ncbi:hypothetical protein ACYF6T_37860 [Streptomyces sp. 7R007]
MDQQVPPAVRRAAERKELGPPLAAHHPIVRDVGKYAVGCVVCWAAVVVVIVSWASGDVFLWNGGQVSPVLVLALMVLIAAGVSLQLASAVRERRSAPSAYVFAGGLVVWGSAVGLVLNVRWEELSGIRVIEESAPNLAGVTSVARRSYVLYGQDGKDGEDWLIRHEFRHSADFVDLVNAALDDFPAEP